MNFRFRKGTQDEQVLAEVVRRNCYLLPDRLQAEDVVIDGGAHIGAFAAACLLRGAGRVLAVEPDPENLEYLRDNLSHFHGRFAIFDRAIWRSDEESSEPLLHSRPRPDLTACGSVLSGQGVPCQPISLDALIQRGAGLIKHPGRLILKLDIEGAEYAALYTATRLAWLDCLLGESHALTQECWWRRPNDEVLPMDHAGLLCFLSTYFARLRCRPMSEGSPGVNVQFWAAQAAYLDFFRAPLLPFSQQAVLAPAVRVAPAGAGKAGQAEANGACLGV